MVSTRRGICGLKNRFRNKLNVCGMANGVVHRLSTSLVVFIFIGREAAEHLNGLFKTIALIVYHCIAYERNVSRLHQPAFIFFLPNFCFCCAKCYCIP